MKGSTVDGPPPPPTKESIPELVLDKKPRAVARERNSRLPPYTGLLIAVIAVILVAVGYGIYRDGHREGIPSPQTAASETR
ncbi:MAG: hypothetical protein BGP08_09475 [Rhizobiales bacterium 64-17]|nr:MAG: hypothetical protein BGP08_09475 [Rhizobiales bacterium 64-17]